MSVFENAPEVAWAAVTVDCRSPSDVAAFWSSLLGHQARTAGADRPGWFRIGPLIEGGPVLNFQPVTEGKVAKAPLHLDLWVDDLEGSVDRVLSLGGSRASVEELIPGRGRIVVMLDPEGHEFCLIAAG